MANKIIYAATITPANAAMEVSTNGGTSFAPLAFATVGSNQQGTLTGVAAATYAIGQLQLRAVGYAATMLSNTTPVTVAAGAQTYTQAVYTDAPIYYNRLNTAALASTIGMGTFTIANGGTTGQPSALPNDPGSKSIFLDGVDDVATAAIDLSAYGRIAVEFWVLCQNLGVPFLVFGDPAWEGTPGGWAYATTDVAAMGAAFCGVTVGSTQNTGHTVGPGGGWTHMVLVMSLANGFEKVLVGGVVTAVPSGGATATLTKFGNSLLRLKGTNVGPANIQELAIYADANIPSDARFAAHAAAQNI